MVFRAIPSNSYGVGSRLTKATKWKRDVMRSQFLLIKLTWKIYLYHAAVFFFHFCFFYFQILFFSFVMYIQMRHRISKEESVRRSVQPSAGLSGKFKRNHSRRRHNKQRWSSFPEGDETRPDEQTHARTNLRANVRTHAHTLRVNERSYGWTIGFMGERTELRAYWCVYGPTNASTGQPTRLRANKRVNGQVDGLTGVWMDSRAYERTNLRANQRTF